MNQKHLIGIHGYMLIYSVASRASFEMISIIRDKILNATGADTLPMVIVGNKTDLEAQREVPKEEGQKLAESFGAAFTETSAKDNTNVNKAFELLIGQIDPSSSDNKDNKGCIISWGKLHAWQKNQKTKKNQDYNTKYQTRMFFKQKIQRMKFFSSLQSIFIIHFI